MSISKLQQSSKYVNLEILQNSQMSLLINLIPKIHQFHHLSESVFNLIKLVLELTIKEGVIPNHKQIVIEKISNFLKIREIFSLKELFFRSEIKTEESLVFKTRILSLFIKIISIHQKLKLIKHNEYLGVFKHSFSDIVKLIQNRSFTQKQNFTSLEIKFIRTFLKLFKLIVKKNISMDTQIFESRNDLINLFFFPLMSFDEHEQESFEEDPKEFVFYGQDIIDMKKSETLKCEVFGLFDLLCEYIDGFHVFTCDYLSQIIMYCTYDVLFNDQASSQLEAYYMESTKSKHSQTESNPSNPKMKSFVESLKSMLIRPKEELEKKLVEYLTNDKPDSYSYNFGSLLNMKEFYEQKKGSKARSFSGTFPTDIQGKFTSFSSCA
jgi:hypothetical protein